MEKTLKELNATEEEIEFIAGAIALEVKKMGLLDVLGTTFEELTKKYILSLKEVGASIEEKTFKAIRNFLHKRSDLSLLNCDVQKGV